MPNINPYTPASNISSCVTNRGTSFENDLICMLWAFIGSFPGYKFDKNHKYYFAIHFSDFRFGIFCPIGKFNQFVRLGLLRCFSKF